MTHLRDTSDIFVVVVGGYIYGVTVELHQKLDHLPGGSSPPLMSVSYEGGKDQEQHLSIFWRSVVFLFNGHAIHKAE